MPLYEYKCENCGHITEKLQSFSDTPITLCPHCKKNDLKRTITAPSFQLKGSGWYATDYKKEKNANKNESPDKNTNGTDVCAQTGKECKNKKRCSKTDVQN